MVGCGVATKQQSVALVTSSAGGGAAALDEGPPGHLLQLGGSDSAPLTRPPLPRGFIRLPIQQDPLWVWRLEKGHYCGAAEVRDAHGAETC